jgi:hypothetical protein
MRLMIGLLVVAIAHDVSALSTQFGSAHKSEAEIARMAPEQRVEEYCKEYVRHSYWHRAYGVLLEASIIGGQGRRTILQSISSVQSQS